MEMTKIAAPTNLLVISLMVLLLATGCRNNSFDKAAARKEIETTDSLVTDLMSKGDATGLANCYTTDAQLMMPNSPTIEGRRNIQAAMMEFIKSGTTKMNFSINNVWGDEEALISEGTMSFSTDAGQVVDRSKYITVYKKEDGKWKIYRDCFNSDLPLLVVK